MTESEEIPYSNRELNEKFKNLDTLIREKHDDTMIKIGEIIVQTSKTNGSVANLKMWRAYITGALAVMGFFIASIAVPLLSSWVQTIK